VTHLLEELPYPSDPSVGGLPSINVLRSSCHRSFRLLPLSLPQLPCHLARAHPRVSIRALALEWRLFFLWSSFRGGVRATPGGSPRALGGVFDSFEGYIAQSAKALLTVDIP